MNYITGYIDNIPQVSTKLTLADFFGAVRVRWSINRNSYRINPGLYAVGNPNNNSDIFVSANYKLSFDHLRKNLSGLNAWILVIDTKGINVWCAAGKGTFGTKELISKIETFLSNSKIETRKLILPQLGAVGVSAQEVKSTTGYNVIYGPVEARDIKDFIKNNYKATEKQRIIEFNFKSRLILTPVEIIGHFKYLLFLISLLFIIAGFKNSNFSIDNSLSDFSIIFINLFLAYVGGTVIVPILLPYIPFRNFSFKGLLFSLVISASIYFANLLGNNILEQISFLMMNAAICSFTAMNFTGTSTYTSYSGVIKEMKIALPIQIFLLVIGFVLWIINRFL